MIVENNKVCCNCRHNIRVGDAKSGMIECVCDVHNRWMGYVQVMEGWCRHWAKEKEVEE